MQNLENNDVKVSVIILTFNHEKFINQALDGVLSQKTDFRFEVLVGNDASTDGTDRILCQYQLNYPNELKVFTHRHNIGGTKNLATLLRQTRGTYIASCEGDDYWTDPLKLQKQVDFLEAHSEYIGCTHGVHLVNQDGSLCNNQTLRWIKDKPIFRFQDFKGIYLPGHPVSMVYRNIFAENPLMIEFITKVHYHIADRTIAMLLSMNGDIVRLNDCMACYRQSFQCEGCNLTSQIFASNPYGKLTDMEITNRLEEYIRDNGIFVAKFDIFRLKLLLRALAKAVICRSYDEWDCFHKMLKEWSRFRKAIL